MPPTKEPDYTYSSDSSDDDDDDDDVIPASFETTMKSCKKKSYWIVSLREDGAITEEKLKVWDIWSLPTGKKVIIPCNELGQPIDDAGGLLGGFLGDLGSDYAKFPMCYKSWCRFQLTIRILYMMTLSRTSTSRS